MGSKNIADGMRLFYKETIIVILIVLAISGLIYLGSGQLRPSSERCSTACSHYDSDEGYYLNESAFKGPRFNTEKECIDYCRYHSGGR